MIDLGFRLRTVWTGDADPYRTLRVGIVAAGTGQTGGGDGIVAAGKAPDPFRHLCGHFRADDAVGGDRSGLDTEYLLFDADGIGGDGAKEIGGGAGNRGEKVGDFTSGAGFRGADGLAGGLEEASDGRFQAVVLLGVDEVAQDFFQGCDLPADPLFLLLLRACAGRKAQADACKGIRQVCQVNMVRSKGLFPGGDFLGKGRFRGGGCPPG